MTLRDGALGSLAAAVDQRHQGPDVSGAAGEAVVGQVVGEHARMRMQWLTDRVAANGRPLHPTSVVTLGGAVSPVLEAALPAAGKQS
ncbi:hypothetical protein [Streptomyces sp. NPDC058240]|uniref:hypothetical protein n=1 Tax=Streptomyces sp. NPDC058240 TaxID=3346396 RepID=UPI0036F15D14